MDEIDNIIIHSLRQIGCNVDEEIHSLSSFTPELLVSSVSRCLTLIKPTLEVPLSLPPGMAQRFTVTSNLAEACKAVGFRGDIGYQTFLYTNVTEVRRVFMFLIERLPKEAEKIPVSQELDYRSTVKQEISRSILQSLNAHWLPSHCQIVLQERRDFLPRYLNIPKSDSQEQATGKSSNFRVGIFDQTTPATLLPSVIARNDEDLWDVTGVFPTLLDPLSRDSLSARDDAVSEDKQLQNAESASEETEKVPSRDDILKSRSPLEVLEEDIENLRAKIEGSVGERQGVLEEIESGKSTIAEHEEKLLGLRKEKRVRERTNIVLENPEENVTKLEAMVANSREKLKKLELQWREHEAPLLEALSSAEKKNSKEFSKSKHLVDQIATTRERCHEITQQFKQQSTTHSQLTAELAKVTRTINRNAYTSRILEIIGNIRKQKNDIDKVLRDTRELQKTINTVTGQLDRQFTVTDDLIYRTARKDDYSRKAYKLLATLHADCAELVNYVQETGATTREIRDLEDQIETEKMRNVSGNLERILADLHQMQKESQVLEEKIRSAVGQSDTVE